MTTLPSEYYRPEDWPSAFAALNQPDRTASPLTLPPRVPAEPYAGVDAVIDLSHLGLAAIRQTDNTIELGVLVPLQDLVDAPWRHDAAAGILAEAAHLAAHPGLRHLATVGGVLSQARSGPPEVLLALLALDAAVLVYGPGQARREIPLADFLGLEGSLRGEVVAGVTFAKPVAGSAGGLARVARTPRDEAIVAAAAVLVFANGTCQQARLCLAGAGVAPRRARAAEMLLEGQAVSVERIGLAAAAAPEGLAFALDLRGSATYRHAMAAVVARRSLTMAWKTATTP
jgi:aerobic carbon-monoxide dehydrogenase medium subunit